MTSLPRSVKDSHWNHWSVCACERRPVATGRLRTLVVVPVNEAPPLLEVLSTILLLHAPAVLTPSYNGKPVSGLNPCGTHPLASLEVWLMYDAYEITSCE